MSSSASFFSADDQLKRVVERVRKEEQQHPDLYKELVRAGIHVGVRYGGWGCRNPMSNRRRTGSSALVCRRVRKEIPKTSERASRYSNHPLECTTSVLVKIILWEFLESSWLESGQFEPCNIVRIVPSRIGAPSRS